MKLHAIRYRLRNDFQLAVMTLFAAIALLGITPGTVLRAINGQRLPFAVDFTIQAGILGSILHMWLSGDTRRASLFLAYFLGVMATIAVHILGAAGEFWFYPAMVANFFLVDRRHALAIALAGLTALLLTGTVDRPPTEAAAFFISVIVCALLTYTFSYRTAMQRKQLETLASHDELTGIFNRRTLVDELDRAQLTFERDHHRCGILMLDIDHFKQINDRYGHLAGDKVLIELASLLERNVRKNDRVFRYGGEEFVVLALLPNHDGLVSVAEKLRGRVEQGIHGPDGRPITISLGGAILRPGESIEAWFARADTSLYVAKNSGRNRAVVDPDN
ncbi:MAG: GGDEF domain-containing protein [Gammaproteobacteria bacterium]|nr:GGDEF domain-containing protein [Gammaproteobacteria bacterium]MBU1416413.1 GGDEF domain-containing protein [Gammaproteobacteria bacterium]